MTKDSRLEKFLKALCSLDYSDLPTPLSRVEVLWNCLITGEETPDFQPQSRTEKYLMTILGVYDLEDIPQPISRAEMLLYKLATGDTDIELEDGAKSRYERLLSEIITNGGVGGVVFEYVTYVLSESFNTLYNTVNKSVKSAILKGNTLVNIFKNKVNHRDTGKLVYVEEGDKIQTTFKDGVINGWVGFSFEENVPFEIGKTYTVMNELYKCDDQLKSFVISLGNKKFINSKPVIGINKLKITIPSDYTAGINWMYYDVNNTNNSTIIFSSNLLILEGDYTQEDIPYFEGMQSVKMPVLTTSNEDGTKTNILSVNEEVHLRKFGNIEDELNLLTGELAQRTGEIVLNGSEDWRRSAHENSTLFYIPLNNLVRKLDYLNSVNCDKLVVYIDEQYLYNSTSPTGISAYVDWTDTYPNENWLYVKYADSEGSVEKLKQWLSQNPITVQYELATESVKTVDLSTLDQDGNETKLKTFNDITHVSLSSEGLIPEAEMTVATKNLDDISQASTMSLRMNDISEKQSELQNEVDTQSENIDSTMMATTEIYEQTL